MFYVDSGICVSIDTEEAAAHSLMWGHLREIFTRDRSHHESAPEGQKGPSRALFISTSYPSPHLSLSGMINRCFSEPLISGLERWLESIPGAGASNLTRIRPDHPDPRPNGNSETS